MRSMVMREKELFSSNNNNYAQNEYNERKKMDIKKTHSLPQWELIVNGRWMYLPITESDSCNGNSHAPSE